MAAPRMPGTPVLKDVVAFVEVWSASGTENYSKTFTNQLVDLGAKVSKTFNKQVTHVVFKDGHQSTWDRAQKRGVKLVSVLWVDKCRTAGMHIDESLFPAANTHEHLPRLIKKKRKCMQPKDFIPRTPENDKRLQKKFEKMANELHRQKASVDNDLPVPFLDSHGSSLTCSPTIKMYSGQHSAMERKLQEMRERRENLSPTSSQVIEKSYDDPVTSSCDVSLNALHDISCSEESGDGGLHLSFDDLRGHSGCGNQERKSGGCVDGIEREACVSSPELKAGAAPSAAAPQCPGQVTPLRALHAPAEEGAWRRGPAGEVVSPGKKQAGGAAEEALEACGSSPTVSATKGRPSGRLQPGGSSAREKRAREDSDPPAAERPVKRKCSRRSPEGSLQPLSSPVARAPDSGASAFEDYFSPHNLSERPSSSGPGPLSRAGGLSKPERTRILETADFSCLGKIPGSADRTRVMACTRPSLQGAHAASAPTTPGSSSAARGTPGCCPQADAPRGALCPDAGGGPHSGSELAPRKGHGGPVRPSEGSDQERKDLVDGNSVQEEGAPSRMWTSSEGIRSGPTRRDGQGSRGGGKDLVGPQEESKTRDRGQKPTRTLVMTSMPPEKQDVVIRVVDTLKGFSVAAEVCETTTHVLVGTPRRTLNALLGLARGCWLLSYEWILWSLELGHWISEEPFELSDYFPAAPLCRRERHLQGTLFADQPVMFISPASDPPRAKLWELVLLCGGRVVGVPRQASVFIGPSHGRKKATVKYLSEKWILDSVSQHKVCSPNNYLLPQ